MFTKRGPVARRSAVLAGVAFGALSLAVAAAAQAETVDVSADDAGQQVTDVIVTGSRTAGRTVQNSAAPVDVISGTTLTNTGASSTLEALNRLLPSFNVPALVQPDLGSIVRGGQLRGLDPAYTLVLINGKRRHTTSVVNEDGFAGSVAADLALIPAGAIQRVEVLRDGASAVYGSDAIAGVINIILKDGKSPSSFSVQTGQTYEGDGAVSIIRGNHSFALGDRGHLSVAGEFSVQSRAVRNFPLKSTYLIYPALNAAGQPVRLGVNNSLPAGATADPREATRDNQPWKNAGQHRFNTGSASFDFGYDMTPTTELYAFGTYAHRKAWATQNFRPANTIFINNPGLLSVYPDGFTPFEVTEEDDFGLTGGIKGEHAGWNWDLSTTYGQDKIDVYTANTANYSLTYPNAQTGFYIGQRFYSNLTTNLDLNRSVALGGHDFSWSVGLQQQHETAKLKAGEPLSYFGSGSSALTGYQPVDAVDETRDSYAAYTALSTYITPKWFIDGAVRYEHYSDFGDSTTGRLSSRYDFTPNFAVRGTVSNGFHAPSLVTASYSNTSDHAGVPYRLAQPDSAAARALGAQPLKPEESTNYSLGFTANPGWGVRLALDAYQIEVKHQIGASSNIGIDRSSGVAVDGTGRPLTPAQVTYIDSLLQGAGFAAGTDIVVHYFTDVGDTRTRGVDFTAEANSRFNWGNIRWSFAANFNKIDVTRISPVPTALQNLPNIGTLSTASQYNLRHRAPHDKQVLGAVFDRGPWTVDLREVRYGELTRYSSVLGAEYKLDATFVTDLSVAYQVNDHLRLTATANNLFDEKPQRVPQNTRTAASLAQYEYAWDNSGPVGLLGGVYSVRLDYSF